MNIIIKGYALITKQGNLVVKDGQLPIYWLKKVAEKDAQEFKCLVKQIIITI